MADGTTQDRDGSGRLFLVAALVLLAFAAAPQLARLFPNNTRLGKSAPDFSLEIATEHGAGDRIHLADLRGKTVLIDFWATWCGPCQMEAPIVNRVAARMADRGLVVLGVNTGDEPGLAAPWAAKHGIAYPQLYDAGNRVANAYGVSTLPTLVLIDAEGRVSAVRSGLEDEADIEAMVREVL